MNPPSFKAYYSRAYPFVLVCNEITDKEIELEILGYGYFSQAIQASKSDT
jgi:hypothetical protein